MRTCDRTIQAVSWPDRLSSAVLHRLECYFGRCLAVVQKAPGRREGTDFVDVDATKPEAHFLDDANEQCHEGKASLMVSRVLVGDLTG
jgi:hypothetical protein